MANIPDSQSENTGKENEKLVSSFECDKQQTQQSISMDDDLREKKTGETSKYLISQHKGSTKQKPEMQLQEVQTKIDQMKIDADTGESCKRTAEKSVKQKTEIPVYEKTFEAKKILKRKDEFSLEKFKPEVNASCSSKDTLAGNLTALVVQIPSPGRSPERANPSKISSISLEASRELLLRYARNPLSVKIPICVDPKRWNKRYASRVLDFVVKDHFQGNPLNFEWNRKLYDFRRYEEDIHLSVEAVQRIEESLRKHKRYFHNLFLSVSSASSAVDERVFDTCVNIIFKNNIFRYFSPSLVYHIATGIALSAVFTSQCGQANVMHRAVQKIVHAVKELEKQSIVKPSSDLLILCE